MSTNIESRLNSIEDRLASIEEKLSNKKESDTPPNAWPTNKTVLTTETIEKNNHDIIEENLINKKITSGTWLGIVAVICFVVAAGFIIELSIETGWLTPHRILGITTLLGITLIGSGIQLLKFDRGYASLLPAAGIIVFFLTILAGHSVYALFSFNLSIRLISIIAVLSILLYIKIRNSIYPVIAAIGCYLLPLAFYMNTEMHFLLYYSLCCSILFAFISIYLESRVLAITAAYLAILSNSVFVNSNIVFMLDTRYLITLLLPIHFILFSIATYIYSWRHHTSLSVHEAWAFFPVLLLFYAAEYYAIYFIQPTLAPWIALLFAGGVLALYKIAQLSLKSHYLKSESVIFAFVSIIFFHAVYIELLTDTLRPWLFVFILLVMSFLPKNTIKERETFLYLPGLSVYWVILLIEYVHIASNLFFNNEPFLLVSFAAVASLWLLRINCFTSLKHENFYDYVLLGVTHLLALMALYRFGDLSGELAISSLWLFYAVAVLFFSFLRKDKVMANSALFVFSFAAGKALLYDAASASSIVRIACLILTGIVLYGAGYFMKKITKW